MAKAMYIGVHEGAYLSTDISNVDVHKEVTSGFNVLRGFKIKFKPQLSSNAWQHVLNLGGTGNNTILCLGLNTGKISLEHSPTLVAAHKQHVFQAAAYVVGDLLEVEFLVDPTTYIGTCKINGVTMGTLQMDSTAAAVSNSLTLFNCEQNSQQRRPTQIDWYSLEIYDGNTLLTTYTPYLTTQAAILTHQASGGLDLIIPINDVVYHGAQDKAHKVTKIYVGDSNNQARNVVVGYVGNSNDEAGCFFGTPTPPPPAPSFSSWSNTVFNYYATDGSVYLEVLFDNNEDIVASGNGWLSLQPVGYGVTLGTQGVYTTGDGNGLLIIKIENQWWSSMFSPVEGDMYTLEIQSGDFIDQNTGESNGMLNIPVSVHIIYS